jgi:hypothetical protein
MKLEIVDVNHIPVAVRSNKKHLELYLAVERLPAGKALKLEIRGRREAKTLREAVRKFMKGKGREIPTVSNSSSTELYIWAAAKQK